MWSRREFVGTTFAISVAGLFNGCSSNCSTSPEFIDDLDGVLDLVAGLSYVVIDQVGDPMSDGLCVPRKPDGMACFQTPEGWVLMRNHEISDQGGGVTRVVLDPKTLEVRSSNQILTGTTRNCGGGVTPWGWLSAEETTDAGHGWVFLCDPNESTTALPQRIEGYGRFKHEAAAYDESTGICYLTEDETDSCLYRFVPTDPEAPFGAGRFQALAIVGDPRAKTTRFDEGERFDLEWVDVEDSYAGERVHEIALAAGAANFVRGEGAWFTEGKVVFVSTSGGPVGRGQIFELDVNRQVLTVLTVVRDRHSLYRPDNITIGPNGDLWICEDNRDRCLLQVRTCDGCIHPVARAFEEENELAGVCFSPDGRVLFVNLWRTGITVAILGLDTWRPQTAGTVA